MELVYLWVEDYKNIKKQGFNFSPRFTCNYDYETKELTIAEKEHIENFFGVNINVTAIVGENGSGKSSVIECLNKIFLYTPDIELGYVNSQKKYPFSFIMVVNIKNKQYYLSSIEVQNTKIEKANVLGHLDYYVYLAEEQIPEQNDIHKEGVNHRISLDKNKIAEMITSSYISKLSFELTTFMYLPIEIEIKALHLQTLFSDLIEDNKYPSHYDFDVNDKDLSIREEDKRDSDTRRQMYAREDTLNSLFEEVKDDYHKFLIVWYIREFGYDDNDYQLNDKVFLLQEFKETNEYITEKELNLYFKSTKKSIHRLSKRAKEIYFKHYKYFFNFDFIDSLNRRFNDLSHGEQTIFGQLLNIYYYSLAIEKDTLLLFFNEPDLALHPQWQKMYLSEVIKLLAKITNKSYHFILTSHSPFILSDLPKENVIFLEKGKQVDVDINPFGANIHTLLSHGFFMKDGLMGEFAKSKIEDIINYLNEKESTIKDNSEAQKLLNIIGEPLIKNQLQKMLDSKRLSKVDEIDNIKLQIEQLTKRLDDLADD